MAAEASEKELKKRKKKKKSVFVADEIGSDLNERQKNFCHFYLFPKETCFNAARSYMAAYDLPESKYKAARSASCRLITNVSIKTYISELLNEFDKTVKVDEELHKVIAQNSNLIAKMDAVKEYNKLKQRIHDKVDLLVTTEKPLGERLMKRLSKIK